MSENELSNIVIGQAIEVYRSLGPGLLESAYRECLYYDLVQNGLYVEKEKPMPIVYKDVNLITVTGLIYWLKISWCLS
jgi:GxxExxY protein